MSRSRRPSGGSARGMRHHTSHIIPNPSARRRSSGITMPRAGGAAAPRGAAALGRAPAAHLRSGPAHLSGLRRRDADPRVPHRARGSEVGAQGVLPGSASPLCLVHSGACRGRLACATPAISIAARSSNPSGLRPRRTGAVSPFLRPALNGRIREVGRLPSRHRSSHLKWGASLQPVHSWAAGCRRTLQLVVAILVRTISMGRTIPPSARRARRQTQSSKSHLRDG